MRITKTCNPQTIPKTNGMNAPIKYRSRVMGTRSEIANTSNRGTKSQSAMRRFGLSPESHRHPPAIPTVAKQTIATMVRSPSALIGRFPNANDCSMRWISSNVLPSSNHTLAGFAISTRSAQSKVRTISR